MHFENEIISQDFRACLYCISLLVALISSSTFSSRSMPKIIWRADHVYLPTALMYIHIYINSDTGMWAVRSAGGPTSAADCRRSPLASQPPTRRLRAAAGRGAFPSAPGPPPPRLAFARSKIERSVPERHQSLPARGAAAAGCTTGTGDGATSTKHRTAHIGYFFVT